MAKKKEATEINVENIEKETINFDFDDKDIVIVVGTKDNRFSMLENKEYKVSGALAKILIQKGAGKLKN